MTKSITKPVGLIWTAVALLFVFSSWQVLVNRPFFWSSLMLAAVCSQVLIVLQWQDAKWGTVINLLLLAVAVVGLAAWRFEQRYRADVQQRLAGGPTRLLTEADLVLLPSPVQQLIRNHGAVGRPHVANWRMTFSGSIRGSEKAAWMPFTTEQYNFVNEPARFFFMKAQMFGLPVYGYHAFKDGKAIMDVRLLALIPVQYQAGAAMDKAETVTWLNDLCLFSPGALIDRRLSWQPIDAHRTDVIFSEGPITVHARLFFDGQGDLVNFTSNDRYFTDTDQQLRQVPFSTPVRDYVSFGDRRVPSYGEAVWNLPDKDFCYGRFHLQELTFNQTALR
jgi:hypothetical protein